MPGSATRTRAEFERGPFSAEVVIVKENKKKGGGGIVEFAVCTPLRHCHEMDYSALSKQFS